jgi:archaellum component FlaG (FlaF/FlaG flagellin family)
MDKAVVTIFLLIAGIVCSLVVFNAVYPAINRSSAAISTMAASVDDRIKSNIEIIQTANDGSNIHIWLKNVGDSRIGPIENCDVFSDVEDGNLSRITYGGETTPYWGYAIEGNPGATMCGVHETTKITIYCTNPPASDTYIVKIVLPNGISDEYQFSF